MRLWMCRFPTHSEEGQIPGLRPQPSCVHFRWGSDGRPCVCCQSLCFPSERRHGRPVRPPIFCLSLPRLFPFFTGQTIILGGDVGSLPPHGGRGGNSLVHSPSTQARPGAKPTDNKCYPKSHTLVKTNAAAGRVEGRGGVSQAPCTLHYRPHDPTWRPERRSARTTRPPSAPGLRGTPVVPQVRSLLAVIHHAVPQHRTPPPLAVPGEDVVLQDASHVAPAHLQHWADLRVEGVERAAPHCARPRDPAHCGSTYQVAVC